MNGESLLVKGSEQLAAYPSSQVLLASEIPDDKFSLAKAASFAGAITLEACTVELADNQPFHSLLDALKGARAGDETGKNLVISNVEADFSERIFKSGFIRPKAYRQIQADGSLAQYGQSDRSIQANSLKFIGGDEKGVLRRRMLAENNNCFRLEDLVRHGTIDDYSFVVFSLAEDMPEYGFFTSTMSLSIQVTSKDDNGIGTETAFVAGKDESGRQHDKSTVNEIYKRLVGVDISDLDQAGILDTPLLIHNSLLPNGALDIVRLYDEIAGGTFYGTNQTGQDYIAHKAQCERYELELKHICADIADELIASADELESPMDAVLKLHELSQRYAVVRSVSDRDIDPLVFGSKAAWHIYQARLANAVNDYTMEVKELNQALRYADSHSCPGLPVNKVSSQNVQTSEGLADEDKYGSLTFYCPKGHLNTRPRNRLIEKCRVCNISVKCAA